MKPPPKPTNAVALLKADHQKVKELFDAFEKTKSATKKQSTAEQALQELRIHAAIEEKIFYPALREALKDEEILDEAEEEHRVAKTLIEELGRKGAATEHFEAKFMVLAENVRHHIKEEEGEMFKQARAAEVDLKGLAEQLSNRKEELMGNDKALEAAEAASKVRPYQELG
jgi:hemerythrin superfamily protein